MNFLKKILKRGVIFMLVSSTILASCASCNGGNDKDDSQTTVVADYDPNRGIDFSSEKKHIVKDGVSLYKIVHPTNTDEATEFAAKELYTFINKITGITAEVIEESAYNGVDKVISVGETKISSHIIADSEALNKDGFIIKTEGDNLFIKGSYPRATLYGVYDFVEKLFGVKFIAVDYTYIPKADELFFYSLDIVEKPTFAIRSYYAENIIYDGLHAARMRMVAPFDTNEPQYGGGYLTDWNVNQNHSFFEYLPPSKYAEAHPEWYRLLPENPQKGQLCLTNGITDDGKIDYTKETSVILEMLKNVKKAIRENENIKYLMLGQQDNNPFCDCERCKASYERFNETYSGTLMVFINLIAEEIERWANEELNGRKINIVTFAYQFTEKAPVVVDGDEVKPISEQVRPRDNVYILIAPINSCFYHPMFDGSCTRNATSRALINNWNILTKNIMIWDYNINYVYHQWYFANKGVMKENLIAYEERGVHMIINQGAPRESKFYQADLDNYIFSKLQWNPHRDVNKLVEEFNHYYYGKYHEVADKYYELMERHFAVLDAKQGFHTDLHDCNDGFFHAENYPIEFLEQVESLVQNAINDVDKDTELTEKEKQELKFRLTKIIITPQMMLLKNYNYYYEFGEKEYAKKVIDNLEYLGAKYYAEKMTCTIAEFRTLYGL
ncbi:MAG: DUF4838 domain-containing protein [Clostridiales bacterium]|nr:DUF4838 domain-containing protein [Clostridiales bacterium]